MKERIRELADGKIESRLPEYSIRPEKAEGKLNIDGLHRTEILIESKGMDAVRGIAYSSHSRVEVLHPTFCGRKCSIHLEINTIGLSGQAVIEGNVTLVTNAGCRLIPYYFTMKEKGYGINERVIKTIEDFSDFAMEEPVMARQLYRSRSFTKMPFMHDLKRLALYQSLLADRDEKRNMEEFLAACGAKESLTFELKETKETFHDLTEDNYGTAYITRNTWGYGKIEVSSSDPFLVPQMSSFTTEQFENEKMEMGFSYQIRRELLGTGVNTAYLSFRHAKGILKFEVEVVQSQDFAGGEVRNLKEKKEELHFFEDYLSYRISQINEDGQEEKKLKALSEEAKKYCEEQPDNWQQKLLLIYTLILLKQDEEADRYLDEIREDVMRNRISNNRAYCFFLYLRALFNESQDQMDTAAKLIQKYYGESGEDPALMFLILKTDASFRENPSLVVLQLKEMFKKGCHSPFIYLTACECYRKSPDLLRMLNDFELQVIFYGAKKGILTENLAIGVARASVYETRFKPFTLRMLRNLYEKYPRKEILESICCYLIRCGRKEEKYFSWYEDGVKEELTVVGLNEYYIYALPKEWNKALPEALLLYFAYSQDLRDDIKEIIYENILLYYDEESQVYKEYASQMEEYAIAQLLKGKISRKLVPLYRHLVIQEMIDERLAKVLPDLLMAYEITCSNPNLRKVIIRCPELNYEDSYTLENGKCCASIYTDDSLVIFLDQYGNRYSDVSYEKELLFSQPELLKRCEEVYPDHLMFVIRKCQELLSKPMKDVEELKPMNRLLSSAEINIAFKLRLVSRILEFYMNEEDEIDDEFLINLDLTQLGYHDRRKALECLIRKNHFETAYEYIRENSVNGLKYDSLMKLAENHMEVIQNREESYLLSLCLYLFSKNIVTEKTQAYLCSYYNGPDEQMREILFACRTQNIPMSDFAERVLAQMMFCGDFEKLDEVFAVYEETCETKDLLERAYYSICCYDYFIEEKPVAVDVFEKIETQMFSDYVRDGIKKEYEGNDLINVSLLAYYVKNENVTEHQKEYMEVLLKRLCSKGLLFGFYSLIPEDIAFPEELNGKYILEHRSRKAKRVFMTSVQVEGEEKPETVLMKKMFYGIYVCTGILFADETLRYSIAEEWADGSVNNVKEKEHLTNDMVLVRKGSLYDQINEFARLFAANQENLLEDALLKQEAKEYTIGKLFAPL